MVICINDLLSEIIATEEYVSFDIKKKTLTAHGNNFMGDNFEVQIDGQTAEGKKSNCLFIKSKPTIYFSFASIADLYLREKFAYSALSDLIIKIQKEGHVPLEDTYQFVKSYKSNNPDVIILNNMAPEGFVVFDRFQVISLEYAEFALKQLAKFHSFSFVIQKQHPKYYSQSISSMKYVIEFNEDWEKLQKNFFFNAIEILKTMDAKNKLKNYMKKIIERYNYHFNDYSDVSVLCHGDFRVSNILIKQKDCKISKMIPIDYQLLHYGNPVNDILQFIFGSTDQKFRRRYFDHLKNVYHGELGRFLHYFNINIDEVYSRKAFDEDFKKRLDFGLLISIHALPFILATEDDAPDLKQELSQIKVVKHDLYVQRINEIVEDFIEIGI